MAIGASAGGPVALAQVLEDLPADFPVPVLVVQHMPAGFTAAYARRLDSQCRVRVREAEEGDELAAGRVLLAPGGLHLTVARRPDRRVTARLDSSEPVNGHRPSVDVLAASVELLRNRTAEIVYRRVEDGTCQSTRSSVPASSAVTWTCWPTC